MTTRLRRPMLVLGTTILVMQAVFMPVGMVYAETKMETEEQELVELPLMKNYLEEEEISDPRFFFTRSRMQGTAEEPLQVTFFSDQEVSEARVLLPEEATLLKDQLPAGISVEEGTQPNEWIVQSKRAQNTFVLPLVVEQVGNYELSVEETTAHLEISEKEETSEEVPVEEIESSDEDQAGQEELKEENGIEEEQENEQPAEEVREPVSEAPQEQQKDEEETDEASHVVEPTVFDGETAEVTTMAQFREAVGNPDIGIISVQANLTEATANVLTVDRPLLIQGNGYTLTFGINGFYFQLEEVTQASTIRLENATLTKVGATPLINATVESSKNWTVELEDITEVNANNMRLASLPEGSIHFTGGVSNFTRTTSTQTFIVAKEVLATNQAEVTISRGNATVFFSSATVSNPKLTVEQGATITITTTAGVANTIDLRGENSEVFLQSGELDVATVGTTAVPTDTTNNTISLTGTAPKITINSSFQLTVRSTLAKRGIHLAGKNAQLLVNNSEISVTSATQSAINITGDNANLSVIDSLFDVTTVSGQTLNLTGTSPKMTLNKSSARVVSTTGVSMTLSGRYAVLEANESELAIQSTTGQRMNLIGSNPVLNLKNSQLDMKATTGRGIYLQGETPQVLMENSQILMTDTGASQGMILQGTDALLSLSNQSELEITGAGTGALENIQIGNNNARPELSVTGKSKLSVTTTSGTGAATDTANNAIHLRGADPKTTVTGGSELLVSITSNARRGVYLNGDNPELLVTDSQFDVTTVSEQTLNLTGTSPKMTLNKSSARVVSTTGVSMTLSGSDAVLEANESELAIQSTTGQRMNLIGSNPVLNLKNSQLDMKATSGRGIYLRGATPQVLMDNSQLLMTDTGPSQGMILQGTDALLSLSNQSELEITGAGTGALENIQIGNNNARPELSVTGESKLSVTTTSGTGAATDTENNAIHLRGADPKTTVTGGSELLVSITSNARRGVYLNGDNPELLVTDSQFDVTTVSGQTLNLTGTSPKMTLNKSSARVVSTTGVSMTLSGRYAVLEANESELAIQSTTGQRMNLIGSNPVLNLKNSQLDMKATSGRGIYLQGATPQVLMDNSQLLMTDTGPSQGMILQGTDALLSLSNQSELAITGAGTGTFENIQIGNNNARPELSVTGESKVSVTTTSGTSAATDTINNAIHLRGTDPKAIFNDAELNIEIISGSRRGLYLNGINSDLRILDSKIDVTTVSGQTLNLTGTSPKMTLNKSSARVVSTTGVSMTLSGRYAVLEANESELAIQSTTGQRMNLIGSNSVLNLKNSQLDMKATSGRGIYLQGATPQVLMDNSQLLMTDTGPSQGMILQGTDALLSLSNQSELAITGAGTGTFENIQIGNNNARPELSVTGESKVSVTTTSGTSAATDTINNAIHLRGTDPKAIFNDAELNIEIISGSRRGLYLNGINSDLRILDSKIDIKTLNDTGLRTLGNNGTNLISNSQIDLLSGTSVSIGFTGNLMKTSITNNSKINSDQGMYFAGQEVIIDNNSEIDITNIVATNVTTISDQRSIFGVLTFERRGSTKGQLTINHSGLSIDKRDGERIRGALNIVGGDNELLVENGGSLNIVNEGSGTPDDSTTSNANAGVGFRNYDYEYNTTLISNNDFIVRDPGSRIDIQAKYGAAVTMSTAGTVFDGSVTVKNQGYFVATGNTAGNNSGVFVGRLVHVTFDNPLFIDFTNYRTGGGQVFGVSNANSTFTGINSDLALWENNSDLLGDPFLNFRKLDYSFRGINYDTLVSSSDPDQLNTDTLGTTGLLSYTRISSNNGRWAIADELRVPTNADKKIHGRVSLPVGLDDSRPAWDDEALVTVEVESPSGETTQEYTTKTVGDTNESPGISIYGEEPRGGLFEIDLDEPLEAGSKVRISKVELTSGELTDGFEHQILTDTVEVFPIIPPTPAQFSSSIIAQDSAAIQGVTDNLDAEVTATHNGEPLNTESVSVDADGRFSLDLSEVSLEIDDEIQVFLRDAEGSAVAAGVVNPPETNNTRGNINPSTELIFHDVTFEPATTLIVGDLGPVSPVDPLDPEIEVDPENKPELPEDQGQLSIDFVSSFNFGSQAISVHDQTYYAKPQRLLNEDGTVNEDEERPNYVQISDRRSENERNGWTLAVTQKEQFKGEENQVLYGASLSLSNQQVITAQGGTAPELQSVPCTLVPGTRRTLLHAQGSEGTGTWIYRFGDGETAGESIALNVPKGANPEATTYSSTLIWELSAVPGN
ncbi:WxL domain-containing protein [Enterococcus sp. AZ051]|uniref:WxL domain-containing protein n=2 Tax=Enterococcus TaxID=1350 RepID=UPI003D2D2804